MKIIARCHPALEPILPKPVLASRGLPQWLRDMPSEVPADALGGAPIRTLKHCPPVIDALGVGLLIPLAADVAVTDDGLSWDWSPPVLPGELMSRSPVGLHLPEQAQGGPVELAGGLVIKFMNFWTLEAPPGWSILFTHPLNREDLPFRTLSGVVDCDGFKDGHVHFPAVLTDPGFRGVLPAGTPVAQAIPIPREDIELQVGPMSEADIANVRDVQTTLRDDRGAYRRHWRRRGDRD